LKVLENIYCKKCGPSPRGKTQIESVGEHLLWRIPGPKVTEMPEGCINLHNEEYTDLCLWNVSIHERKKGT